MKVGGLRSAIWALLLLIAEAQRQMDGLAGTAIK
jgi:hypothetical protein